MNKLSDQQEKLIIPCYTFFARLVPSDEDDRWVCIALHPHKGGEVWKTIGIGDSYVEARHDCLSHLSELSINTPILDECADRDEQRLLLRAVNDHLRLIGGRVEEVWPLSDGLCSNGSGDLH